jgi:hypothetical protein
MKNETVFDKLTKGLGDAVTDIREKVVEEGWFGRVVNERDGRQAQPAWPQAREAQPEAGEHDRAADMDLDR